MSSEITVMAANALCDSAATSSREQQMSAVVRRHPQHPRDPLKVLAEFIATALTEKFAESGAGEALIKMLSASQRPKRGELTVTKLFNQYLDHARTYYCRADGTPTGEIDNYLSAMRIVRERYGRTSAAEFRPLKLKAVRDTMIEKSWCRRTINSQVGRIKRVFRWAVENELLPAERYHALQAVTGLKRGRTAAREPPPVKPASDALIEAALAHVSKQVAAMIRLQLLTGMRPGEVCIMRTCDVNRDRDIWTYRPSRHKNDFRAQERTVYLGPQAKDVLAPFLKDDDPEAYIFSAAEAEKEWRRQKHAARRTPLNWGNAPGTSHKRRPKNRPGDRYRTDSYRRAISRACAKAFPQPEGLTDEQAKAWIRDHHWHPHQLRHNAATQLRKQFGIDAAQVILGHKTLAVTAIYAEKNTEAAMEIMRKVG
jgi:integrase